MAQAAIQGTWPMAHCLHLMAAAAKSLQSCLTLCDPMDGSPPGSPIPGILQARTLEWVAISFSNAWEESESEVTQSCLTLSDPMDFNLPDSSVHGIFQARVLEWGAIAFSVTSWQHALTILWGYHFLWAACTKWLTECIHSKARIFKLQGIYKIS